MGFLPDRTGLQGLERIPKEIQEDGGILLCLRLKTEGAIPLTSLTNKFIIMRFYVSVTQVLNRVVATEAEDYSEAINKVQNAIYEEEITLNQNDWVDEKVTVCDHEQEEHREAERNGTVYQEI